MDKCLVISGNNSQNSNSESISHYLAEKLKSKIWISSPSNSIPFVSNELIKIKYFPTNLIDVIKLISEVDQIVFVVPQYNWNFSGFFKNFLDWLSINDRKFLENKKVLLISVSSSDASKEFKKIAKLTFLSLGLDEKKFKFINFNLNTKKEQLLIKLHKNLIDN